MAKRFKYQATPTQAENVRIAHELYRRLFNEDFPADWRIYFSSLGQCDWICKEIVISMQDARDAVFTLIHEFLHMRHPEWKHGERFAKEENRLLRKLSPYFLPEEIPVM